jgi:hypothetical protein
MSLLDSVYGRDQTLWSLQDVADRLEGQISIIADERIPAQQKLGQSTRYQAASPTVLVQSHSPLALRNVCPMVSSRASTSQKVRSHCLWHGTEISFYRIHESAYSCQVQFIGYHRILSGHVSYMLYLGHASSSICMHAAQHSGGNVPYF